MLQWVAFPSPEMKMNYVVPNEKFEIHLCLFPSSIYQFSIWEIIKKKHAISLIPLPIEQSSQPLLKKVQCLKSTLRTKRKKKLFISM